MNQALQLPASTRVEVAPGVGLHCMTWGTGAPVVLCHGLLFGSLAAWYFSTALPLSARRKQVVLYDLRGHGRSDAARSGYDLATQVHDLESVVRETVPGMEPVTLVGHSYGAMIALAYAIAHPERVAKLVLVDAPHPLSAHVRPGIDAVRTRDDLYRRFHAQIGGDGRRAERLRERLAFLLFGSTLRDDIHASADFSDATLAALRVPTLCIYGRHSECASAGRRLASVLPDARLAWVDCGHYVTDDAPAAMLAHIESFLGN